MKPAPFEYRAPASAEEAVQLLAEVADDGMVLAGGQTLVAAMNFRLARPAVLVDINGIAEFDYVRNDGDVLRIGALARHAAFETPVTDGVLGDLLPHVARHIAHYPIRTRGTFAGSLAHADPAAEWCLVARTLDAQMVATGVNGSRTIDAADFFQSIFTTDLGDDEILAEVRLPVLGQGWRAGFAEFARRAGDFALAMSLAAVRLADGRITDAKVGLGGVADRPVRAAEAEQALIGEVPNPELFAAAAEMAATSADPTSDIHASADYRRDLTKAMVRRALERAVAP